jgi:hypothetical protein
MSWKKLQADGKVRAHKASKKELDELRAVIARDLEDAAIQASVATSYRGRRDCRGNEGLLRAGPALDCRNSSQIESLTSEAPRRKALELWRNLVW